MGLYSGGLINGRIFASEIWGAYFREGLYIYIYICLDLVKAALLGSRLDTGAARVQASVVDQTWRGLTSRLAL